MFRQTQMMVGIETFSLMFHIFVGGVRWSPSSTAVIAKFVTFFIPGSDKQSSPFLKVFNVPLKSFTKNSIYSNGLMWLSDCAFLTWNIHPPLTIRRFKIESHLRLGNPCNSYNLFDPVNIVLLYKTCRLLWISHISARPLVSFEHINSQWMRCYI